MVHLLPFRKVDPDALGFRHRPNRDVIPRWTRAYGSGRVFYTALGHEEGVWRDPRFQQMLGNAALWAMRRLP